MVVVNNLGSVDHVKYASLAYALTLLALVYAKRDVMYTGRGLC